MLGFLRANEVVAVVELLDTAAQLGMACGRVFLGSAAMTLSTVSELERDWGEGERVRRRERTRVRGGGLCGVIREGRPPDGRCVVEAPLMDATPSLCHVPPL